MKKIGLVRIFFFMAVFLTACNLPSQVGAENTPDSTQVYGTISANLTEVVSASATAAAINGKTIFTPQPILVTENSITPAFTPSLTTPTVVCNRASAGRPLDVTIPDDTQMNTGESFTKTWRLVNTGSCAWSSEYSLVWFSGDLFGAVRSEPLSGTTAPGQTVDINIDMVAPDQPGTNQSNWKLSSPQGQLFGIGPNGDAPIWVRINIVELATETITPAPTQTATLTSLSSGTVTLDTGDTFDLDSGQKKKGDADDIGFQKNSDGQFELQPINNARLGLGDLPENCQTTAVSTNPINLASVTDGTLYCYRTNQGLPGYLRVNHFNGDLMTLALDFTTWNIP
jgi:hypothetical protein